MLGVCSGRGAGHLGAGQPGNGSALLLLHLLPEAMGEPYGPPCPAVLESLSGTQGLPRCQPAPGDTATGSSQHPAACLGSFPPSPPLHPSAGQRGAAPSVRQECLWDGASSMCIIFPLTQGAKLLGSGPGPRWRGSGAAVMVLVHHPAVSERPGGRRDPSVEAHTHFDSGS